MASVLEQSWTDVKSWAFAIYTFWYPNITFQLVKPIPTRRMGGIAYGAHPIVTHRDLVQGLRAVYAKPASPKTHSSSVKVWAITNDGEHVDGILPNGPYPPCLHMADRALLAGYYRWIPMDVMASNYSKYIVFSISYYTQLDCLLKTEIRFTANYSSNVHNTGPLLGASGRWIPAPNV